MPSEKQIAANRRNAQKSTGPRTPEGIAISSQNALKTGVHAESQIIRGENTQAFQSLTAEYYAEYRPCTPSQRALVDTMISSEWLLRRLRRVEADIWNQGLQFIEDSPFQPKDHPEASAYSTQEETLARLQRRLDALDRAWHRALKALRQLQTGEAESAGQPAAGLNTVDKQALSPQIGFVPPILPHPAPDLPVIPSLRQLYPLVRESPVAAPTRRC